MGEFIQLLCCLPSYLCCFPSCAVSPNPADTPFWASPCPPGSGAPGPAALTELCVVPELALPISVVASKTFTQAMAGPVHELLESPDEDEDEHRHKKGKKRRRRDKKHKRERCGGLPGRGRRRQAVIWLSFFKERGFLRYCLVHCQTDAVLLFPPTGSRHQILMGAGGCAPFFFSRCCYKAVIRYGSPSAYGPPDSRRRPSLDADSGSDLDATGTGGRLRAGAAAAKPALYMLRMPPPTAGGGATRGHTPAPPERGTGTAPAGMLLPAAEVADLLACYACKQWLAAYTPPG